MCSAQSWEISNFRSTRFWDNQNGTETVVAEGGVRSGSSLVAEPGMGSLTVTGPTRGVVGAKSDDELGTVSREAGPLGFGVGQMVCGGIGGEVNASELLSILASGNEGRRSAIILIMRICSVPFTYTR